MSEIDTYYQLIAGYRFSLMEPFSSVKVLALCERLVNMSQTSLVMYIHFLLAHKIPMKLVQLTTSCLTPSAINYKNIMKTKMKPHTH